MKKLTLLLLLTLSLGAQAQTSYQLNYGLIRYGLLAGSSIHSVYGQVDLKNVGLGLVSDSILTVLNGRVRKIPRSGVVDSTVYRTVLNSRSLAQTQTALNLKANLASPTFTGVVNLGSILNTGGIAVNAIQANNNATDDIGTSGGNIFRKLWINDVNINSLTASRALVSDASKNVTSSATTTTELGYVSGVTSSIQTQISLKANDNAVVHLTGTESISGAKTFSSDVQIPAIPTNATSAASKSYIDNLITGITWKAAVKTATTANITLSAPQTIDAISVIAGDRVLVKNQTTQADNGIYLVAAGAWTRALDADSGAEIETATVAVTSGTINGDTQWTCTATGITLGSTAITFGQISGAGTYAASTGLTLTGNVFAIDATVATLTGSQTLTNKTLASNTVATTQAPGTNTTQLATTAFVQASGVGTVTSVTGTANQISVATGTTTPVISLPATITGLTSVTSTGFTGALTGNATTATTLATIRTLWGQNFNGNADVTGSLTGVTNIVTSGGYTQSGSSANTLTGTLTGINATFTAATTIGDATKNLTINPFSDGNIYNDYKVGASGFAYFRTGQGAETGAARGWMTLTSSTGAVAFNSTVTAPTFVGALTGNASTASTATTATTATTAATVTNSAQPNISSLGTLSGLTVTAPITGSVTGNAGTATLASTVTTNANLTGPITSVGNATSIASQTGTGTTFAMSASPALTGTPTAPTATAGTNTTQVATTAFVTAALPSSGTYTPTLTNVTNISASTAYVWQYQRIGNTVTIWGEVDFTMTATVATELGISLPIASNLTNIRNITGTWSNTGASAGGGETLTRADITNDRISVTLSGAAGITRSAVFSLSYVIL